MAPAQSTTDVERVLEVTLPDSSIWQVPCELIALAWAAKRARHGARNGDGDPEATFQQDYETTLEDDNVLLERAAQLYWIDSEGGVTQMCSPERSTAPGHEWHYERGWFLGAKRITP